MKNQFEFISWADNFATGIPQIDQQHQIFIQFYKNLSSSLTFHVDMPSSRIIFEELIDYADYHFRTEENIWHQFLADDPLEAEHKKSHNDFVSQINRMKNEENSKPLEEFLREVVSFLTLWLTSHILESDKRMAKVVLAVQSGLPLEKAKLQANQEMLAEKGTA